MALMISISGIRGIFGTDLTPEHLVRYAAAYGTWIDGGTVVVGRDTRVTGPVCEDLVISALRATGCDVIRVGVVPTPTVAMAVLKHNADGGIVISASHNPAEWNALKLLNRKSEFLDAGQGTKVMDISEKGSFNYCSYDNIGTVTDDPEALEHHIDKILALPYIDAELIGSAGFSVAIDPVNGTGGIAVPALLKALGIVDIHGIHTEPTGIFAHNPEPLAEHMKEICELVREKECDIGIVTDPDTDRLALVTDKGALFGEENTQAAAADFLLSRKKGPLATNLSSSQVMDDVAKKHNQSCFRSAVGEINVVKKMQEVQAVAGGEGNGGVINPDLHYGRDALVGIAMILQMLAEQNTSLSEYRTKLPEYFMTKSKVSLNSLDADQILENVARLFASRETDTTDGLKIHFEEGWVHLRKSNTEPIIRIYAEATSSDQADKLCENVKKEVIGDNQ